MNDALKMDDQAQRLTFAVLEYVDAVRLWGVGNAINDQNLTGKAIVRQRAAEETILDLTGTLDVLLPLLRHENAAVRLISAGSLLPDHRDAAVTVLRELDVMEPLEISFFAGWFLQAIGVPNKGSGFKKPQTEIIELKSKRRPPKVPI